MKLELHLLPRKSGNNALAGNITRFQSELFLIARPIDQYYRPLARRTLPDAVKDNGQFMRRNGLLALL